MALAGLHPKSILASLAILALGVSLLACQPQDERAGLWLTGDRAAGPVADWSFTAAIEEIFVETRPWYGLRHSTTIWCVDLDGRLYVGSYGEEEKAWEKAVAHDAEARLRIDGQLHDVTLVPVTDPALRQALDARYDAKYDMQEVFGEDVPGWRYYRVGQSRGDVGSTRPERENTERARFG